MAYYTYVNVYFALARSSVGGFCFAQYAEGGSELFTRQGPKRKCLVQISQIGWPYFVGNSTIRRRLKTNQRLTDNAVL